MRSDQGPTARAFDVSACNSLWVRVFRVRRQLYMQCNIVRPFILAVGAWTLSIKGRERLQRYNLDIQSTNKNSEYFDKALSVSMRYFFYTVLGLMATPLLAASKVLVQLQPVVVQTLNRPYVGSRQCL